MQLMVSESYFFFMVKGLTLTGLLGATTDFEIGQNCFLTVMSF